MIRTWQNIIAAVTALLVSTTLWAKVKVVVTIPDLAYAVEQIGGDLVEVTPLLRGVENPHHVDAIPDFIRLVADADVVCLVGLDLEVGYMPLVLARSGNARVQPQGEGYCEVGLGVEPIQKPTSPVDRSMGDIHPAGNPHYYMSPALLAKGAIEIFKVLSRVDRQHSSIYADRLKLFQLTMNQLTIDIGALLQPLKQVQSTNDKCAIIIEYHEEFAYFLQQYGLRSFGTLEEKPGVPPSAGRLAITALAAKACKVRVLLSAEYYSKKILDRFSELSGAEAIIAPAMTQPSGKIRSYPELQYFIANQLLSAIRK